MLKWSAWYGICTKFPVTNLGSLMPCSGVSPFGKYFFPLIKTLWGQQWVLHETTLSFFTASLSLSLFSIQVQLKLGIFWSIVNQHCFPLIKTQGSTWTQPWVLHCATLSLFTAPLSLLNSSPACIRHFADLKKKKERKEKTWFFPIENCRRFWTMKLSNWYGIHTQSCDPKLKVVNASLTSVTSQSASLSSHQNRQLNENSVIAPLHFQKIVVKASLLFSLLSAWATCLQGIVDNLLIVHLLMAC